MVDIKLVAIHNYSKIDNRLYCAFERMIGRAIPNAMVLKARDYDDRDCLLLRGIPSLRKICYASVINSLDA